jgi:hypothetical protein
MENSWNILPTREVSIGSNFTIRIAISVGIFIGRDLFNKKLKIRDSFKIRFVDVKRKGAGVLLPLVLLVK